MATNKVFYSFLHRNEDPYTATGYYVYRQDISGGTTGPYDKIATLVPTGYGNPIKITGVDDVPACGVTYNYKCSAINAQGQVMGLNPVFSGISFPCQTPTPSVTRTPAVSPSSSVALTPTPSLTATPSVTPTITPSLTLTPSLTPTASVSATPAATPSVTPTITNSVTVTPTLTPTASVSATPAATPSVTPTITNSVTVTPTQTATPSLTPTQTVTPTVSITTTPSLTVTPSLTPTQTATPSLTPTQTVTPTVTTTLTPTVTVTPTQTVTPTVTPTITPSQPAAAASSYVLIELTGKSPDISAFGAGVGLVVNSTNFPDSYANLSWPDGATGFRMVSYNQTPTGHAWWDHTTSYDGTHDTHWNDRYGPLGLMDQYDPKLRKPTYVDDPAGANFGNNATQVGDFITQLGLFKCTDGTCTAGEFVETIAKDAGNNDPIAIYTNWINKDYTAIGYPASATIRFSGEWLS